MSPNTRLFIGRSPRSIVLSRDGYNFRFQRFYGTGQTGPQVQKVPTLVIKSISSEELSNKTQYVELPNYVFDAFLGLITVHGSIYLMTVSGSQNVAFPRWRMENARLIPYEKIYRVIDVDFFSLDSAVFDSFHFERSEQNNDKLINEHPCGPLKKMFRDGSFHYSKNLDISTTIKNHGNAHSFEYIINNCEPTFIWNSPLVEEIITWRGRVPQEERQLFDNSQMLAFVIRGFCRTAVVQKGSDISTVTLISRISTEAKEYSLSNECMNEEGEVPNSVESEIVVTTNEFMFSYKQLGANIPLFWEYTEGQLLSRKLKILKDAGHTQLAFEKHFDTLESKYGVVSVVNLVKPRSESQETLAMIYKKCAEQKGVKITNLEYSLNSLTKTPHKLLYLLKEDIYEFGAFAYDLSKGIYFGKQTGVLRISTMESVEKQVKVQMIISKETIELATKEIKDFNLTASFIDLHDQLWVEHGMLLDRLYSKNSKNLGKYRKVYFKLFHSKVRLYDPLHFYITQHLKQIKDKFTYEKDTTIFCGTFNISGKLTEESLRQWLVPEGSPGDELANIYIIGLEELIELTPGHMLSTDPYVKFYWEKKISSELNAASDKKYIKCWSTQLGGVLLLFFAAESEASKIKNIEGDVRKTGFGGMTSNKGAVAMSFNYSATSFCVIVSHLAAGLDNVEQRHNDYKTIFKNIRFARGSRIKDHDAVIWMGDFNYRILMSNEDVRRLIQDKEFSKLFQRDQLNQQMISGESFPYFHEMPINFPPTYKFDPGTKTYDTSEKMRIPAWTDRILTKGEVLKQLAYGYADDITFSDHRPVYATFQARITVVDDEKRNSLFTSIYERINTKLASMDDAEKTAFLNENSLDTDRGTAGATSKSSPAEGSTEGANPGNKLPPPSSDMKKWWIGRGKQVKVVLNVDPSKVMLNSKRDPNPFTDDKSEPLFINRP
ncbi:phosphoinositide 5-phosphatase INP51 KNAG_0E03590 [Huiozyma naganishii CBS 8797]|uniref:phosphoinositide 5-phosphatase n=1 Tax=Huiozyma naganishii (strain ATCC MYA-139 / BCRC 22969 / CBS 8797 / KCTC 17520 / NBRC 10181 / NCYC 3082 / Yp74L-3) TaxID=1071383 RepID=J7S808_HUIN7|nr:hypothetical protein KNAG_0E03590 [Kazachstania naganishii CBS 8797]CCK70616.1 hypothetical protein KNAG_0E03590 [Kazachstania naganishii CBS 8797]